MHLWRSNYSILKISTLSDIPDERLDLTLLVRTIFHCNQNFLAVTLNDAKDPGGEVSKLSKTLGSDLSVKHCLQLSTISLMIA